MPDASVKTAQMKTLEDRKKTVLGKLSDKQLKDALTAREAKVVDECTTDELEAEATKRGIAV